MAHSFRSDDARELVEDLVASPVTQAVYDLAEGVIWDDRAALVRWVDIRKGRVLAAPLMGRRLGVPNVADLGQTTGAIALAEDGGLLVAGARGLIAITPSGYPSYGPDLLGARTDVRFNDGSVDPQGRFVVGTLSLAGDTGQEVLLRISGNGDTEVLREGVHLSNGVGFSPDGTTIYHVDTLANAVSRHSYGPGSFNADEPWVTVLEGLPALPDGLTVDSEGALWIAQWGGSSVRRHATNGELLAVVTVDATQVSCPAFIGPDLDVLAITTAQEGLVEPTDQSGAVFVADVGVAGMPAPRWAGSTITPYWVPSREETGVE